MKGLPVFNQLAKYYDIIYQNKNYQQEAEIIHRLIKKYLPSRKNLSLLDIGCGTGKHLGYFHKNGYQVTGLDKSASMLKQVKTRVELVQADARNFKLNQRYDVIVSLFHVLSYQITNQAVLLFLENVNRHLNPGGLFLFDCWYGPGVVTNRPEPRYNIYQQGNLEIHRFKNPTMDIHHNTVRVNHHLVVTDKKKKLMTSFKETHAMRYFFFPDLEQLLKTNGLKVLSWGQFDQKLSRVKDGSWDALFVVQKI